MDEWEFSHYLFYTRSSIRAIDVDEWDGFLLSGKIPALCVCGFSIVRENAHEKKNDHNYT